MNLAKARQVIRDDAVGSIGWAFAAGVIMEETESEKRISPDTLADMLICLERGGLAASTAVCVLYGRTGRPWPEGAFEGSRDPKEWKEYLHKCKSSHQK